MPNLRHALLAAAALLLTACTSLPAPKSTAAVAPAPWPPQSMLWLGNSFFYYNNSMHGHVGQLLRATPIKTTRAVSATISGSGLNWHDLDTHFRPNAVGSYSFVANNAVVFNTGERALPRPFDAVLMMDCSQCPVHPQLGKLFHETAAQHAATARKHGAHPVLFMSWAYQDAPEMTQTLAAEYIKAGKALNARVVPAGLAFARSIAKRPEVNLYTADKRHPSLAGTYLAAATVVAAVYGATPVGNPYTAGLPADVAAHLQAMAWETVQAFKP